MSYIPLYHNHIKARKFITFLNVTHIFNYATEFKTTFLICNIIDEPLRIFLQKKIKSNNTRLIKP